MTIKKARKILGKEAGGKSDEEILDMIGRMGILADVALDMFEKEQRKKKRFTA